MFPSKKTIPKLLLVNKLSHGFLQLIRQTSASIFRMVFRIPFFRHTYYGFYKRMFAPLNLFKGVKKKIQYRKKIKLELEIEDWIQQNLYFLNEYEEKEIRFIERFLQPGNVFVDIGANIGQFALVASAIVGDQGRVYAFEPFERNYQSLLNHININHSWNIIPEKTAVSDRKGFIELYLDETENNLGMATSFTNSFSIKERVASTSLDGYFQNPDTAIHLIKIDIEGGECLALRGMEQIIKKCRPAMLIEINPEILINSPFNQHDVESLLLNVGYKKFFLSDNGTPVTEKRNNDNSCNYLFLAEIPDKHFWNSHLPIPSQ